MLEIKKLKFIEPLLIIIIFIPIFLDKNLPEYNKIVGICFTVFIFYTITKFFRSIEIEDYKAFIHHIKYLPAKIYGKLFGISDRAKMLDLLNEKYRWDRQQIHSQLQISN